MKLLSLFISILALIMAWQAYQNTKSLQRLTPLAEAIAEGQTVTKGAKEKVSGAKEAAGQMLIDLGHQLKGKN